jgi:hypothetical protein
LLLILIIAVLWTLAEYGPDTARRLRLLYVQGRCARFEFPANTVIFDSDRAARAPLLANPEDYVALDDAQVWPVTGVARREPACWASLKDILFAGRIPFVGEADSKRWIERIDQLLAQKPRLMVTGHGQVSRDPAKDLALTRDYLQYLRTAMGKAAEDLTPFDEAYAATDWSRFAKLPAFEAANRINAYGTYLLMERELLKR